ncbi:uncharacterized protein LOC144071201 isoform X2 [Stigmatopora argus]
MDNAADGHPPIDDGYPRRPKRARGTRPGTGDFLTESEMDALAAERTSDAGYKLTDEDVRKMVELRAANEALFTGRRNSAKPAWRAIVKEMGLSGKVTADQVAKKWDNLKTRFKDLKFPPRGLEARPQAEDESASWPWFRLMDDALEGRLAGNAALLAAAQSPGEADSEDESPRRSDAVRKPSAPSDVPYKMSERDTRRLIALRADNEVLFTGKRNAAKAAWRNIVRQLDLQGKVSACQAAKKWDNLKRRYKDLKYPPAGMEDSAEVAAASWPWFRPMSDALEGRLAPAGHDREYERRPPSPRANSLPTKAETCPLKTEWAAPERGPAPLERDGTPLDGKRDLP